VEFEPNGVELEFLDIQGVSDFPVRTSAPFQHRDMRCRRYAPGVWRPDFRRIVVAADGEVVEHDLGHC
jgi:hypothetical protein